MLLKRYGITVDDVCEDVPVDTPHRKRLITTMADVCITEFGRTQYVHIVLSNVIRRLGQHLKIVNPWNMMYVPKPFKRSNTPLCFYATVDVRMTHVPYGIEFDRQPPFFLLMLMPSRRPHLIQIREYYRDYHLEACLNVVPTTSVFGHAVAYVKCQSGPEGWYLFNNEESRRGRPMRRNPPPWKWNSADEELYLVYVLK